MISSILMKPRLLAPVTLMLAGLASAQATQPAPNAVRLTKYILGVSDLDHTYAFYHALGMDFENPKATLGQPNTLAEMLLKLVDVPPGTKFRNIMLKIPNAPFSLEATEFSSTDLHPVEPRIQDPGASLLVLMVRDVEAALKVAKRLGGQVVTTGGVPVTVGTTCCAVIVKDPDGYYVEFQKAPGENGPNITGARFVSVVQDAEKAAAFYHDKLGFETKVNDWTSIYNQAMGTSRQAQFRTADATIPGTNLLWRFAEFKDIDRTPYAPRIPDPGAPALGLQVRDLDAAVGAVKAAGGASITQGGSVGLGNGKVGFVRDPGGVLVELAQPR
jgi:catechol 2,3-dioxygenase-like lactoylglutathione lyase family enzyme